MEVGAERLKTFQKVERSLTEKAKALKQLCAQAAATAARYNVAEPEILIKGRSVMDRVMVTVLEALLLRALSIEDGKQSKQEVRLQMQRMTDQKVGAVCSPLLQACQKAMNA